MRITRVSAVAYSQDLKLSGPAPKLAGEPRTAFQTLLVKVETDAGIVGWDEAFAHRVVQGVKLALDTLIAPHCVGADPTNISALMDGLIRRNQASVAVVPHSAYFGPGLVATAHVVAAFSRAPLIERLYCDLAVDPFGGWNEPVKGALTLPTGPGLGGDPDEALLERCRVD